MPATARGWMITPDELRSWILQETEELMVLNKPPLVVCHPSKEGPWSSIVGACREFAGLPRLHMPSRLDRETSGVLVLAKTHEAGSRLQRAAYRRRVRKSYWAILTGELLESITVDASIGAEAEAAYAGRQRILPEAEGGKPAVTEVEPIAHGGGYTFARIRPHTGRLHQIRVHSAHIGHPIAGDKLYPDAGPMMWFIRNGFDEHLARMLPLPRQALHASEIVFTTRHGAEAFQARLTPDLADFCRERIGFDPYSVGSS